MGGFLNFDPIDPDQELEEFLNDPVTDANLAALLGHETSDGEYTTPSYVHPTKRYKRRKPVKAKPISRAQAIDSLLITGEL